MSTARVSTARPIRSFAFVTLVAFAFAAGCKTPKTAEADADANAVKPNEAEASSASSSPEGGATSGDGAKALPNPPAAFREAVRHARWEDAEAAATAMTDAERDKPQVKLARARAAIERSDAKLALTLLTKLEEQLPLLETRIKRMRRVAMAEVGPFDVAAEGFFAEGTPKGYLAAARAYERAHPWLRFPEL